MSDAPAIPPAAPPPPAPRRPGAMANYLANLRGAFRFDFPGPVFQKEIWASQRQFAAFRGRMTYVLLLAGILWLVYASAMPRTGNQPASPVQTLQSLQAIAPALTAAVFGVQAGLLTLMAPSLTAGAFSEERRKRTLDVLLTSPIRPWQIVVGKLLSGVASLAVLSLCALPVLLAVRIFGGLDAEHIVAAFAVSLSLATVMAALAMLNSLWCKKPSTAVFLSFIFFCVLQGLPILIVTTIAALWGGMNGPPTGLSLMAFLCCSPITVVFMCLEIMGMAPVPMHNAWIAPTVYNLAVTGVILVLCTTILRRVMLSLATGDGPAVVAVGRVAVRKSAGVRPGQDEPGAPPREEEHAEKPRRKARTVARRVSRTVGDQPILWRELAQPLFRRPVLAILSILGLAGFSLWVYIATMQSGVSAPEVHTRVTNMIFAGILLLQAASLTVAGFPTERESKTWDVLLTAPLSSRDFVIGKFAGALRSLWLMPAALFVNLALLGVVAGHLAPAVLIHASLIFAGPILLLAAMGTRLSVASKNSGAAGMANTGFALFLWAILPAVYGLATWLLDVYDLQRSFLAPPVNALGEVAFFLNPIRNFMSTLYGNDLHTSASRSFEIGGPDSNLSLSSGGFAAAMLGYFAVYAVLSLGALVWATAVFRKKSGRTS